MSTLRNVVTGSLGRSIIVKNENLATAGNMMTGRQLLMMVYKHYRATEVDNNLLGT